MDSTHTREDTNAPSYDSSDEWEIGLGNLIIDLDADLEKDGHHDGAATQLDASPMKVGKMKIKRKVSSSAKGEGVSPLALRKDSNASTGSSSVTEDSSSAYSSPDRSGRTEEKVVKHGKSASSASSSSGSGAGSGGGSGSHKRESGATAKLEKPVVPSVAIKPIVGNVLQMKNSGVNAPHPSTLLSLSSLPSQSSPARMTSTPTPGDAKPHKVHKGLDEGEGEDTPKKIKTEKESKGEGGKRSGDTGSGRKHGGKKSKGDKPPRCQTIGVDTMDIGVSTEPECIGPCEPGTSVNLEGIVWHETDQGVLVVNVTWRNKTYVGTLLDCSRHDWAPPRFCDSPTSDVESRGKGSGRPKRGRNSNSTNSDLSNFTETRSSIHSKLRNSTKGRRGSNASNGTRTPPCSVEKSGGKRKSKSDADIDEPLHSNKRLKTGLRPNSSGEGRNTPVLIECPQPNCNKKYKHKNGLLYHLSHAHHNTMDKDSNWNEGSDGGMEGDSKSNSSDDVGLAAGPTKDRKKDGAKEKRESGKEEESMEVDQSGSNTKANENEVDRVPLHIPHSALPESSGESSDNSVSVKKSECAKNREVVKSPKAHKAHVDKFTAGMKCLGIPKPKEGKSSPSKAPKVDASVDKLGKNIKKSLSTSSDKDMSIFDFNSTNELDEQGVSEASLGASMEKHVNVSVIRPTPESIHIKSEPLSPTSFAKVTEHAKGPKPHSNNSSSSEHGTETGDKSSKKSDKDKSKSEKHKKAKHDKVLLKANKPTRPIAPAPAPASAPVAPPQLVAIPTALVQSSVSVTCTLNVPTITTMTTKPQVSTVSPSLKPIQPKPATTGAAVSMDAAASPSSLKDKDKKAKPKKKMKGDKDREKDREKERDKTPGSPKDGTKLGKEQLADQRPKIPLLPAVPETNILKQALTASGIVEPESGEKSKPVGSETWKRDGNKSDAPVDKSKDAVSSTQSKHVSATPTSNVVIPQIPKLIPTSSVTGPNVRPPKQSAMPSQHIHHQVQQSQQHQPSQLQQQQQPLALTINVKSGPKPEAIGQDRASANLSVHHVGGKEVGKTAQMLSPPSGNRTGNISPAYSDISEDGVEDHGKQIKPNEREVFSFDNTSQVRSQSDPSRRDNEGGSSVDHMPVFHSNERRGAPESHASGVGASGKPPHRDDREKLDESRKGESSKEPASQRVSLTSSSPASQPPTAHVYSGSHYPYLHGYVNMDPSYHMRMMATDTHHRQQQERLAEEQRKRLEKLRDQESSSKPGSESRSDPPEKRNRPIVGLQTEPITPPQAPRQPEGKDRNKEKEQITKSRHIDFQKKDSSSPSTVRQSESEKQSGATLLADRQREEMRQYYLYQQKVFEHQRRTEEQKRTVEQEKRKRESVEGSKNESKTSEPRDKSRTPTPTPRNLSTPTKDSPSRQSGDGDRQGSVSPHSSKGQKSDSKSSKLIEGYSYLPHSYPYGAIPYDPSHPAFQSMNPMVYPAFLHPDIHYPPSSSVMTPVWKPPSEKGGFEHDRDQVASPHSLSSRDKSPEAAREQPPRALDVLQQHANQYFTSQKHNSTSRPRTPEKGRTTPKPRSRSPSPATRKTPESSSSSSTSASTREESSKYDSSGRRHDSSSVHPLVHQHMHTHQHTHVGVGFPVLPPYDPYVLASQQAAAAAAASASAAAINPFSVRREK